MGNMTISREELEAKKTRIKERFSPEPKNEGATLEYLQEVYDEIYQRLEKEGVKRATVNEK